MADVRKILVADFIDSAETYPFMLPMLKRFDSPEGLEAISAIAHSDGDVRKLIDICINADGQMHRFPELRRIDETEDYLRHRKSIADLRRFVDAAARWYGLPGAGPRVDVLRLPEDEAESIRATLDHIAALIDTRERQIAEAKCRLAMNQKSRTKKAAENSAIGFLACSVIELTGKPHAAEAATLAEIALDIRNLTVDRLNKARKVRLQKLADLTTK